MAGQGKLTERVASGVAWSIAEKVGSALLQAVVSIVVANRIMPMDMGIIAVLTVFTTISQVVVDGGFSQALIRKANPTQGDYKAVFRFNIIFSCLLYVLLTAIAPLVARFYGWPLLADVAPVLFLLLPLNALCVIQNTIMVREFRFAQLSTINFLSSLISGIIAITMAIAGMGIWSLVGQRVSMMATKAMLLWWRSEWRPRRIDTRGRLREMAPFSLRLMATDIVAALYSNIAYPFIGKIYSGAVLGQYNQAYKLVQMPLSAMQSIQSVTFPALSRISDEKEKFSKSCQLVIMMTAAIMFPIMAGLIATAEDIYTLLLKPDWHPAIPYFRILCCIGFFYPIQMITYNILKVKSDGAIILKLEIAKRVATTIILILTILHSVMAVAWGMVAATTFEMSLNALASRRYTSLGITGLCRTLLPITVLTATMYGAVMITGYFMVDCSVAARLFVKIAVGVAAYIVGGLTFRLESFSEGVSLVKRFIQKEEA